MNQQPASQMRPDKVSMDQSFNEQPEEDGFQNNQVDENLEDDGFRKIAKQVAYSIHNYQGMSSHRPKFT